MDDGERPRTVGEPVDRPPRPAPDPVPDEARRDDRDPEVERDDAQADPQRSVGGGKWDHRRDQAE